MARTYSGDAVRPHALVQFYVCHLIASTVHCNIKLTSLQTPLCVDLAIKRVKGLTLGGRRLRAERSYAKHSLCVLRTDGATPYSHEVEGLLRRFGDYRADWRPTGCHATFDCYGSYLRAKEALRGKVEGNLWVR